MRLVAFALLLAFSNTPVDHAPRREERWHQLDRAFFVDNKQKLVPRGEIEMFPRETATPLYDSPTHRLYVGTRDGYLRCLINGEVKWTAATGGAVLAQPAILKDDLFVPTAGGELVALNRFTGARRWSAVIKEEITTAPLVVGDRIYVMSSEEAVTAISTDGKPLWKFRRDPPSGFTIRGNARPVVAHGLLYTAFADGNVAALTLDAGVAKWMRNASGAGDYLDVDSIAAPEDDKNVYAASAKAGIVALNAQTGEPAWTYALPGANQVLVDGLRVYAAGRGALVALSRVDGKKIWQLALGTDKYAAAATSAEGLLLVPIDRGPLLAIDMDTGRPRGSFDPGSGFSQAPLALRGAALVVSNDGSLFTLGLLP
jgi:outer membrane protein assembly factor BamB